jgi:hypothetical protein
MHYVKDEMLERNPKTVFGGPILQIKRIKQVSGWEMLAKRVSSVTH